MKKWIVGCLALVASSICACKLATVPDGCAAYSDCPTEDGGGTLDATTDVSVPDAGAPDTGTDAGDSAPTSDGGMGDDASSDASDGAVCDPKGVPRDEACVITDDRGVFVSPSGSDTNAGTMASPVGTIAHAMDLAKAAGKRVYACGGGYPDALVVGSSRDGVSVYGGLDCSSVPWAYNATQVAAVVPASAGYALQANGLTAGVSFADFSFTAKGAPATAPTSGTAQSSVAVFVSNAALALTRVAVTAGAGQPGASGEGTTNWTGDAPDGGPPPNATSGGPGGMQTCADGVTSSAGGGGGSLISAPPPVYGPGDAGTAVPTVGSSNGGTAGGAACDGGPGANGLSPAAGGTGATSSGQVNATGWALGDGGTSGANGSPGQGGGGGGGNRSALIATGSGGGAGGCGGGGGLGGATGGASIGILCFDATLTLHSVTITTANGGAGGAGGAGQGGQPGGNGAPGAGTGSCAGGNGGAGAGGAGGGGGAGGASMGLAWTGTPPVIDGVTVTQNASTQSGVTLGAGGSPGAGGSGGTGPGSAGPDGGPGAAGTAAAVERVP